MPKLQLSWVRSQQPLTQLNLSGGRWDGAVFNKVGTEVFLLGASGFFIFDLQFYSSAEDLLAPERICH
jgi:hypothetical protein